MTNEPPKAKPDFVVIGPTPLGQRLSKDHQAMADEWEREDRIRRGLPPPGRQHTIERGPNTGWPAAVVVAIVTLAVVAYYIGRHWF